MQLPEKIKIAHRDVSVAVASLPDGLMGQFDPEASAITLSNKLSKVQTVETFWHELIHAINDFNRVDVELAMELAASQVDGSNPEMRAGMMEERMTENFAMVFVQVIKDNKLLNLTT